MSVSTRPKIALLDSGVGALTILSALRKKIPNGEFSCILDSGYYPYGLKDEGFVVERMKSLLSGCIERNPQDIIVVACNTASTVALPILRAFTKIPIVGVVPAIKPAANMSKSKCIGILATPATVKRSYTENLIHQFASDCRIELLGSSLLVDLAEEKLRARRISQEVLRREIAPLVENPDLDTVVLACTHFRHLLPELQETTIRPIYWVDSSEAIAERVAVLLEYEPTPFIPHQTTTLYSTSSLNLSPEARKMWENDFGVTRWNIIDW